MLPPCLFLASPRLASLSTRVHGTLPMPMPVLACISASAALARPGLRAAISRYILRLITEMCCGQEAAENFTGAEDLVMFRGEESEQRGETCIVFASMEASHTCVPHRQHRLSPADTMFGPSREESGLKRMLQSSRPSQLFSSVSSQNHVGLGPSDSVSRRPGGQQTPCGDLAERYILLRCRPP